MTLATTPRVPELTNGIDVRTLPLSALEGFVLSRIDGSSSLPDLVALTGLPGEQVSAIVEKLVKLGAVRYRGEAAPATIAASDDVAPEAEDESTSALASEAPAIGASSEAPTDRPITVSSAGDSGDEAEAALYDPSELDEEVDIPRERRKQILDLYYQLEVLDYYEALGVPYKADKKDIRKAYFALSKVFHPDTMFRKNLGSFKAKMERAFNLLTEAYETLSKKNARAEYDSYLRATKAAKMAERALSFDAANAAHGAPPSDAPSAEPVVVPPLPPLPEVEDAAEAEQAPPAAPRGISEHARRLARDVVARRLRSVIGGQTPRSVVRSGSDASPPKISSIDPGAKLSGSSSPPASPPSPPPPSDPRALLRSLTKSLRVAGELTGSHDQVTRAVRASISAFERGDLSEATQQAARAASLAPNRDDLRAEHARLTTLLAEELATDRIAQAKFEMKQGKWASAALTWSKVCEGRPNDPEAHRYAAQALLKAGGEMRSTQRYAQKAVFLAPSDIDARILLAQVYLTIGLKLNARRELDAAAKLDPRNEMVKNLLADLDKG